MPGCIVALGTKELLIQADPNQPALEEKVRMHVPVTISHCQLLERFHIKLYDGAVTSMNFVETVGGQSNDINKGFGGILCTWSLSGLKCTQSSQ